MPKDRAEVQDQYKIGGGSLNEYEFNQSKGDITEQEHQQPEGAGAEGGALPSPLDEAERIRQVTEAAHQQVERRRARQGAASSAKSGGARQGASSSKKSGAKGAAQKAGAAKSGAAGKKRR